MHKVVRSILAAILAVPAFAITAAPPMTPEIEAMLAKERAFKAKLAAAFAAAPESEVTGEVHARGVVAGRSMGEEDWTLLLPLRDWRIGEAAQPGELTLRRSASKAEVDDLRARIGAGDVVRVQARLAPAAEFRDPRQGQLLAVLSVAADGGAERAPVVHEDAVLGRLVLDERIAQFTTRSRWAGADVHVMVDGKSADARADAIATAHALFDSADEWDARSRRVAADQLLALYNDTWREDGPELDAAAFAARLVPESVVAAGEGHFEIWYADADLFGGHSVRVVGSLGDGPQGATIEG
jgi:hypothetical protein